MPTCPQRLLAAALALAAPALAAPALAAPAAASASPPLPADGTAPPPAAEHARRTRSQSWLDAFRGPFPSSRLLAMPTAEVVGAYQVSVSGDASLLTEDNALSTTSVVAIGFGDIAQIEYRNAAAITAGRPRPFGLPTIGLQIKAPYRPRRFLPAVAVALRLGLAHDEAEGAVTHTERATDLYLVARLPLWGPLQRFTLHGGLRVTSARIDSRGARAPADIDRTLLLPAGGWEVQMTDDTAAVGELALVPRFRPGDATTASRIDHGVLGRAGIRWRLVPWLSLDASVGYRIELEGLGASSSTRGLVDWDIRLGGELFIPWGAVACKTAGLFCDPAAAPRHP